MALQDALGAFGSDLQAERGVFGEASQVAVGSLFERLGYEPAYVAGSKATFDDGLAAARRAAQDALDATNRSRALGVIDPALDAAYRTARDAVASYRAAQGVMVRAVEVVPIHDGPLVVAGAIPHAGASFEPGDVVLTLAAPQPTVRLQVGPQQLAGVRRDSVVALSGAALETTCTLGSLVATPPSTANGNTSGDPEPEGAGAEAAGANQSEPVDGGAGEASSSDIVEFDLRCERQPGLLLVGADLVATVRTLVAEDRLVVPATAVAARADGAAFVSVVGRDGSQDPTPVEVIAEAGGFAAVEPRSGSLAEGDEVRVARR